jgi:hypothetical protein
MSHLLISGRYAGLIAKANNRSGAGGAAIGPGIVTTTGPAATDIIHQIPLNRSFYVTLITWYHALGVPVALVFGTLSNAGVPAMVQMFPTQQALSGVAGGMIEEDLIGVEFMLNSQAAPNGWDGSLYVTSAVAGVQISCEVAEKI